MIVQMVRWRHKEYLGQKGKRLEVEGLVELDMWPWTGPASSLLFSFSFHVSVKRDCVCVRARACARVCVYFLCVLGSFSEDQKERGHNSACKLLLRTSKREVFYHCCYGDTTTCRISFKLEAL